MNKWAITFVAIVALLTACSGNQAESNQQVEEQQAEQSEAVQDHKQHDERDYDGEWSSLPEYDTIIEHIKGKDYTFRTVTDNEAQRILLLTDENGQEKYKTILIKNTNRFKIIELDGEGEGQIFNNVLGS